MSESTSQDPQSGGFTLIELLLVVAIIAIMAAVSLPMISNYLKHYKIRGAAQSLAGEMQSARSKAISRNVNLGVVFVTLDASSYRYVIEDDQVIADGFDPMRRSVSTLLNDPDPEKVRAQAGPVLSLPTGITFTQTCPGAPPAGGAWETGFRFNRLGGWCSPDTSTTACPPIDVGAAFVFNATTSGTAGVESSGASVCLSDSSTGLSRRIFVRPGGRVMVQQ
jgi:prepilin-type N-terminal cleavage/methylation domain-containing protein